MINSNNFKTDIEFYGIRKTIEILNIRLENCDETDIDDIVKNIIELDEHLNKYDNKQNCFIKVGDTNDNSSNYI